MSEAERLAKALEVADRSGMWYPSTEAAAELRRLSAELEALKKAISDAQPEAWIFTSKLAGNEKFMTRFASDLSTYQASEITRLYTLKGIK